MKQNESAFPEIGKKVYLDLEKWRHSPFLLSTFKVYALSEGWTQGEVMKVSDYLKSKRFDEQLTILKQFCISPLKNEENISQADVLFLLAHLSMDGHYLGQKLIESWDEYDWSNYTSLQLKATSYLKRSFALFSKSVKEEDKYFVDSPPALFYASYEDAEKNLSHSSKENTHIYAIWIKK